MNWSHKKDWLVTSTENVKECRNSSSKEEPLSTSGAELGYPRKRILPLPPAWWRSSLWCRRHGYSSVVGREVTEVLLWYEWLEIHPLELTGWQGICGGSLQQQVTQPAMWVAGCWVMLLTAWAASWRCCGCLRSWVPQRSHLKVASSGAFWESTP